MHELMKSVEKKLKDRVMVDQRMFQRKWEEGDSKVHRRRGTSEVGGKYWGRQHFWGAGGGCLLRGSQVGVSSEF